MKRKLLLFVLMFAMAFAMVGCEPSDFNDRDDSEHIEEKAPKGTLVITVPEGFVKTEVGEITYYIKENFSSNIVINTTANDGSLASVSGKKLVESMEPALEKACGEDLTLTLIKEQKIEVNGHKGFVYEYSYFCYGLDVTQTQYIFENDDIYEFITFTDFVVEGYTSAFEDCAKSISYK